MNASGCWCCWVGGVDDHYPTWVAAVEAAEEWREEGYDDVVVVPCEECRGRA